MEQRTQDGGRRRRPGRVLLSLLLLLAVCFGVLGGEPGVLSSPGLQTVSLTDPDPPTGVTVTGADQRLDLTWTASVDKPEEYRIYLDGTYRVSSATTSATIAGLVNGRGYVVTIKSVLKKDLTSEGTTASAPVTGTPHDGLPPAAPAGFAGTGGDRQVTLSWSAPTDLEVRSYQLRRDGLLIASPAHPATSYTDTGRVNGVAYTYTLVAVDVTGMTSPASTASVTPRDSDAPAAPTGLAATPGDRQVALSWAAGPEYDIASYRVWRDGLQVAQVTGTAWTDTGRTNGVSYAYQVQAVDTSGNASGPSTPAVSATPHDGLAPAAPGAFTATGGDRQVSLSWAATSDAEIRYYELRRGGVLIATPLSTDTSYADTGLVNGQTYGYTLVAVDVADQRSPAATATATPRDSDAPAAPTGLAATPGVARVDLVWNSSPEYDVAAYRVLRDGVQVAVVTGTSWADTDVVGGRSYSYSLVAVDTSGNDSLPSAPVEATPSDPPPAAPAGLAADAGNGQVALTWDASVEADHDHYVLLRDGVEIATLTTTSYVDTDVVNGTTYTYTLVAVDAAGGRSPESDPVAATPTSGPAPPTGVTATPGDARASIRWTASPDPGVVAYRVLHEDGTVAVEVAAPATSATVTRLTNGVTYRFTVVAVDADGDESAPSDPVEVTPVAAPVVVRVDGAGQTGGVAASGDGRYLVIGTRSRLEPTDTNTAYELYRVDTVDGTKRRLRPLAATASGMTDPTNTSAPAISDDGRYVVLATTAKLLPADTNTYSDVYRLDTDSWQWQLVSVPPSGAVSRTVAGTLLQTGASVHSKSPAVAVSADGDTVLFYSNRADLVAGDTNGKVDLFAKRMSDGTVTRVSTTATGTNMPRVATGPALALTPDGRFAVFPAVGGTGPAVLYRKTLAGAGAGALTVVSTVETAGRTTEFGVFRDAGDIAVSDDGRYVAFVTAAKLGTTTPTANWTTGLAYRKDLDTGAILALGTGQRTVWEHAVDLDPTGRYAYYSTASAALAGDTNGHTDFHRRDLDGGLQGPLVLVTADASGRHTTGPTGSVAVAEYGRVFALSGDEVLVTTSQALAPVDGNKLRDLYAKDLADGAVRTPLA